MSHVTILALARTGDKGGPSQLNSPSPSCEWMERARKTSLMRKSSVYNQSFFPHPHTEERGQERTQPSYFPIPTPRMGREEERASKFVFNVSYSKIRL